MSLPRPSPPMLSRTNSLPESSRPKREPYFCGLAHDAILSALERREIPLDPPTPHLAEPRGAFTSLYLHGELRGCVGYVLPISPVYRAVADTARAAAFEDTGFLRLRSKEARDLQIELSILSPPRRIAAEAVEVGRHGLLITMSRSPWSSSAPGARRASMGSPSPSSSKPAARRDCPRMRGKGAR